jgi:hypothetical protein
MEICVRTDSQAAARSKQRPFTRQSPLVPIIYIIGPVCFHLVQEAIEPNLYKWPSGTNNATEINMHVNDIVTLFKVDFQWNGTSPIHVMSGRSDLLLLALPEELEVERP